MPIPYNLHPGDRVRLSAHALSQQINSATHNRETMHGTVIKLKQDQYPIVRWDHQRPTSFGSSYHPAFIDKVES